MANSDPLGWQVEVGAFLPSKSSAKRKPKPKKKPARGKARKKKATTSSPPQLSASGLPKMRALSIRQPSAEAIMTGIKTSECRTRKTNIRGTIYIYASLGRESAEEEAEMMRDYEIHDIACSDLPRGVVIGTVELYDCTYVPESWIYEWHLRNPKRLSKPAKPETHPQPVWFNPFGK